MTYNFIFSNNKLYKAKNLKEKQNIPEQAVSKKILIVLEDLAEEGLKNFLSKIMAAVKVDVDKDVWLMIPDNTVPIDWKNIAKHTAIERILFFGAIPASFELNIQLKYYHLATFQDCQFLHAEPLEQIQGDKLKKQRLWIALQDMFLK